MFSFLLCRCRLCLVSQHEEQLLHKKKSISSEIEIETQICSINNRNLFFCYSDSCTQSTLTGSCSLCFQSFPRIFLLIIQIKIRKIKEYFIQFWFKWLRANGKFGEGWSGLVGITLDTKKAPTVNNGHAKSLFYEYVGPASHQRDFKLSREESRALQCDEYIYIFGQGRRFFLAVRTLRS